MKSDCDKSDYEESDRVMVGGDGIEVFTPVRRSNVHEGHHLSTDRAARAVGPK